ncbi:MAG: histidine kinase [Propionibacteriaceae bacterium]|nr:histidine kinase [Propionibacteriaceae bacterium]
MADHIRAQERERMARKLHSLTTSLHGIRMEVEMLAQEVPGTLKTAVDAIGAQLEALQVSARSLTSELRETVAAGPTLELTLERLQSAYPMDISSHVESWDRLPATEELLGELVSELVANVHQHALANHVWVSLARSGGRAELQVRDDGCGFDVDAERPPGHFGLLSLKELVSAAGGVFQISSGPGGTSVSISFPEPEPGAGK